MKKILIVEDNPDQKKLARQIVEKAGHYCWVAEDLHEAVLNLAGKDILDSKRDSEPKVKWDGVITDLHFPLITGGSGDNGKAEPRGLEILALCKEMSIPCVVCSDIDHHHASWLTRLLPYFNAELEPDKSGYGTDGAISWLRALEKLLTKIK
ncbi:hypothetical protein FJ208_00930 [Candidatus Gribaldobacteria bacterium]|nr:hypothetical protein [Candidatus Gribaldobacteria bacterium]